MTPELNKIYQGDCLEIMRGWPDKCVDVICTDIPYNCSQESSGIRTLDYGEWDKNFSTDGLIKEFARLSRKSIFIWCEHRQISGLLNDIKEAGLLARPLSWVKRNPTVINGEKIWLPGFEVCAFGKFPGATFNEHCHPGVWWESPDADREHPCQKPLKIIGQQIAASTNEGDIVLDPFFGSGTALLAAERLGRKWIGIEREPRWVALAQSRIAAESSQGKFL